jgi:hypothetical protein
MPTTPFLIGLDLGTTNCAVAFVDTRRRNPRAETFGISQLTGPGAVEPWPVLPSFLYFPEADEVADGAVALPWDSHPSAIVGVLARERGALVPARQVASAKSWLAHPGVDRRAAFLPWGSTDATPRMSPVEASARYLMHLRDAWNAATASGDAALRFERQSIVLTVPASFDEEARELTVESAQIAGLANLTLMEEPIAAFYAWLSEQRGAIGLADDEMALVCDVGGGTTDFSLIRTRIEAGAPAFERVAIGDHLLLGGDNLDIAIAAGVERTIMDLRPSMRLAVTQRSALRRLCSTAKERLLGEAAPDRVAITLLGTGRSIVGGSVTVDVTRREVEAALDGFLPLTRADENGRSRDRRSGLRELGLPYETDPAITRHLAAFLARSAALLGTAHPAVVSSSGRMMVRPDLVLFNGGFFTPAIARESIARALTEWFGRAPRVIATGNLEAAVAVGAATYARLRAGIGRSGALVKAGSGRAYYIALGGPREDGTVPAVCVLARGTEEGTKGTIDHPFTVVTNRAVSFSLYSATTRPDRTGNIVALTPAVDVHEHAPLVTVLRYGRKSRHVELPVRLLVAFTAVGTLELWCHSEVTEHRWRLQFQVRHEEVEQSDAAPQDGAAEAAAGDESSDVVIDDAAVVVCESLVRTLFEGAGGDVTPENVVAQLEQQFGYGKTAWPLGVIRRLADTLIEVVDGRRRCAPLEARWLNLFGFCIRPGFGAAKDAWRISEVRKVYAAGVLFSGSIQNRVEWLVLWQRTAGGFSAGQQREIAQRVMAELGLGGGKAKGISPQIERESWRLLASLERLESGIRVKLGDEVMRRLRRDLLNPSLLWSIGRLGARTPIYGPLTSVVPPFDAGRWLEQLLAVERESPDLAAAVVQIGALTGDPARDVDLRMVDAAKQRLRDANVDPGAVRPLYEVVTATFAETSRAFGEPLPNGLRLRTDSGSAELGDK